VNDSAEVLSMENANDKSGAGISKEDLNSNDGDNVSCMPYNINNGREKQTNSDSWWQTHKRICHKIKGILNKNFNVTGFMKQEADIPTLTVSAKGAVEKLTKNYAFSFLQEALKMLEIIILKKG